MIIQPGHPWVHSLSASLQHPGATDYGSATEENFGQRGEGLLGKARQERRVTEQLSFLLKHLDQAFHHTEIWKERPLFSITFLHLPSSGSLNVENSR